MNQAFSQFQREQFVNNTAPKVGNWIMGDEWDGWLRLNGSSDFDKSYFGPEVFRVRMGGGLYNMAMFVKVTGRKEHWDRASGHWKVRVQLEVPGDDAHSRTSMFTGWMFYTL